MEIEFSPESTGALAELAEPRALSTRTLRRITNAGPWLQVAPAHLNACDDDAVHGLLICEPLFDPGPGLACPRPLVIAQLQLATRQGTVRIPTCLPATLFIGLMPVHRALASASRLLGDLTSAMLDDEIIRLLDDGDLPGPGT